jgi:hypothetical protein
VLVALVVMSWVVYSQTARPPRPLQTERVRDNLYMISGEGGNVAMRVTTEGYASVVRQLLDASPNQSIAFVTEGGYDLGALSDCLDAAIAEASGTASRLDAVPSASSQPSSTARAARALDTVRAAQKGFWHNL